VKIATHVEHVDRGSELKGEWPQQRPCMASPFVGGVDLELALIRYYNLPNTVDRASLVKGCNLKSMWGKEKSKTGIRTGLDGSTLYC
jgi:hypothetical protein